MVEQRPRPLDIARAAPPGVPPGETGASVRPLAAPVSGQRSLGALWRRVFEAPDPQLVHAGAAGELLVAKIRALLVLLILVIPLGQAVLEPSAPGPRVGLALLGVALLQTLFVYRLLGRYRHRYLFWVSAASSALDVSLISAALASQLLAGGAAPGGTGAVIFSLYPLAIFATALRYDGRICVLAGAVAIVEFAAVGAVAGTPIGWVDTAGRLVLLAAATALAAALVVRGRELRHLSTRDPLTGVLNRGFFEERLAEETERLERGREPVVCAMIDIDRFKLFNDTYGHAAGDTALREVGKLLGASFRASDIVARYGGEEFAVVVPGMPPPLAIARLERLRAAVDQIRVELSGGRTAALSVSIGMAVFPMDAATLVESLKVADRRLYQAKRAGRNRVSSAG
jgi:diguanylate cyclase (GGDEF)-like protein